jgi:hypothetical protein
MAVAKRALSIVNVSKVDRIISKEREDALSALIDDASPSVHEAVLAEFRRLGEPGQIVLRRLAKSGTELRSAAARVMLEELESISPGMAMKSFIEKGGNDLLTGSILISAAAIPGLDTDGVTQAIDAIAARAGSLVAPGMGPLERCKLLNRTLFHEYGFRGVTDGGDDPANIAIAQVLRRRRGLPLALCVVYILVARRIGLMLDLIDMPGRFMVGCRAEADDGHPFFVDPFDRGAFRQPTQIFEMLRDNDIEPDPAWFNPLADSHVLYVCCRVLAIQFSKRKNVAKSRMFEGFFQAYETVMRGFGPQH